MLPLSSLSFGYLIPSAIVFSVVALFEKNSGDHIDIPKVLNARITLHDEDVGMLYYISEKMDEPKSEVIRKAIKNLYDEIKDKE